MRKKYYPILLNNKTKVFLLLVLILYSLFLKINQTKAVTPTATASAPVNGSILYNYKSNCANADNLPLRDEFIEPAITKAKDGQDPVTVPYGGKIVNTTKIKYFYANPTQPYNYLFSDRGIIVPQNVTEAKVIYIFWHGRGWWHHTPNEMCGGSNIDPQLCATASKLGNAVIFAPHTLNIGSRKQILTQTEMQCFFDEALAILDSKNIKHDQAKIIVAGHSAGGNFVEKFVKANYTANLPIIASMFFDASYGGTKSDGTKDVGWAETTAGHPNSGKIFIYYNDPASCEADALATFKKRPDDTKLLKTTKSGIAHYQVPIKCFLDHLIDDKCTGGIGIPPVNNKLQTIDTGAETPPPTTAPTPPTTISAAPTTPITPKSNTLDTNMVGSGIHTSWFVPLEDSELDLIITKPKLAITIPGLTFTNPGKIYIEKDSTGSFMYIPYLGEYMSSVYRYAIVVAGIIATIMIFNFGFAWIQAGGDAEKVNHSKDRIGKALIGLFIAITSYVLLYTINPELVNFKNLRVRYIEPVGEYNYFSIETEPEKFEDYGPKIFKTPSGVKDTTFDNIFKAYEPCIGVDWRVLKGMAWVESGFRYNVINFLNFAGLFQTQSPNCSSALQKFGLQARCTAGKILPNKNTSKSQETYLRRPNYEGILDPETSTMVGASMMMNSIEAIRQKCPTITSDALYYFIYIGHQSGLQGLKDTLDILKGECAIEKARDALYKRWLGSRTTARDDEICKTPQKKRIGLNMPQRCAKEIADEADKGGKRMLGIIKSLGGSNSGTKSENRGQCPLYNTSLIGKAVVDLSTNNKSITTKTSDIKCPSTPKRILALGDSLTAHSSSYIDRIKKVCGDKISIEKIAEEGKFPAWMFEQIKDRNLKGFNDLFIQGGVNGICGDAETVKSQLTKIYYKAKSDGLRVIAINLNPSKNWWENGGGKKDQTAIAKCLSNTIIVNKWLYEQQGNLIDMTVDQYSILDSNGDQTLDSEFDSGDHLHYNAKGQEAVAKETSNVAFADGYYPGSGGTQPSSELGGQCFPVKEPSFDRISSNWGDSRDGGTRCHTGIDIYTKSPGTVTAIDDGTVTAISKDFVQCSGGWGGPGTGGKIMIYHPNLLGGKTVNYGEIDAEGIILSVGDEVKKNQVLGKASHCGMLHFELYQGEKDQTTTWLPPSGQSSGVQGQLKCFNLYQNTITGGLLNPTELINNLKKSSC